MQNTHHALARAKSHSQKRYAGRKKEVRPDAAVNCTAHPRGTGKADMGDIAYSAHQGVWEDCGEADYHVISIRQGKK